jgi:hypothetical protein
VVRYESLTHFLDCCVPSAGRDGMEKTWDAGERPESAWNKARHGDPSIVASRSAEIERLVAGIRVEGTATWVSDVVGSTPIVAAVVSGNPMAMRRRVKRPQETRTVRIYVSQLCSGSVPAEAMIKRGCAILALIGALQAGGIRVSLDLVIELPTNGGTRILCAPCEEPIDLSRVGYAIAHPGFIRHTMYCGQGDLPGAWNGGWPSYDGHRNDPKVPRKLLGCEPGDIFVPMASAADPLLRAPDEWVAARVKQAFGTTGDAA